MWSLSVLLLVLVHETPGPMRSTLPRARGSEVFSSHLRLFALCEGKQSQMSSQSYQNANLFCGFAALRDETVVVAASYLAPRGAATRLLRAGMLRRSSSLRAWASP